MKNVLVIGSTGQIGSELTMALRKRYGNEHIIAGYIVGCEPKGELAESGPSAIADVTDGQAIAEVVKKYHIDTIYNLAAPMGRLYNIIADRFANPKPGSYTATLDAKRVREKVEEEAEELCEADTKDEVIWEAADLIYFVNVLLYKEGVTWQDVYDELDRRHKEK